MRGRILYFAPIDWDYIIQRPQHLAIRLSKDFDFYYIQPFGLRPLRFSDIRRIIYRLKSLVSSKKEIFDVKVVNPYFIPIMNRIVDRTNVYLLSTKLQKIVTHNTIFWVTTPSPLIYQLLLKIKPERLVYEMLDDYTSIHPKNEKIPGIEKSLINKAHLIITTSNALYKKAQTINPSKKIVIVSNGVNFGFFEKAHYDMSFEYRKDKKIVGYIGTIDRWIDFEAVEYCAVRLPDIQFVFVGPIRVKNIPKHRNIHYLGAKPYNLIPVYCKSFDVCIIPFKKGNFADTINPVKLYEYFSLGKPVVAFRMKELEQYKDLLYLAETESDFYQQVVCALEERDFEKKLLREKIARDNDWDIKATILKKYLFDLMK